MTLQPGQRVTVAGHRGTFTFQELWREDTARVLDRNQQFRFFLVAKVRPVKQRRAK